MWLILFFWVLRVCLTPGCSAQVQLDAGCPPYVSEGGTLICSCVYAAPNAPPDLSFSWPGHSISDQLKIENVGRALNGTDFTCEVTANGQTTRVVYTLQVAYGPAHISITGPRPIITNGRDPVTLTCSATEVNPTPKFTWTGVNCSNGNGKDTCTFTPTPADEGKVVTCSAWNSLASASGKTASGNFTLSVNYGPADVSITRPRPIITNGRDPVTLTCLATEVNPTPEFTWTGVNCSNGNQGYGKDTCTFTPTLADEGKVVTCTARNPLVRPNGQTASGNFTLSVNYDATMAPDSPLLPAIGGGVGVVVAVVVIIAVVVVVRRKGRTKGIVGTPEFNSATPDSPDDGYEVPVSRGTPGANETEDHYDRLEQSDIGLRSLYSAISQPRVADRPPTLPTIPVSSSERTSSTGEYIDIFAGEPSSNAEVTGEPYESLQMSDVNVPSVYSALKHSINKSA